MHGSYLVTIGMLASDSSPYPQDEVAERSSALTESLY